MFCRKKYCKENEFIAKINNKLLYLTVSGNNDRAKITEVLKQVSYLQKKDIFNSEKVDKIFENYFGVIKQDIITSDSLYTMPVAKDEDEEMDEIEQVDVEALKKEGMKTIVKNMDTEYSASAINKKLSVYLKNKDFITDKDFECKTKEDVYFLVALLINADDNTLQYKIEKDFDNEKIKIGAFECRKFKITKKEK